MKQNIIIGTVVDDGTGDYLRRGGDKINKNFEELYTDLGDGQVPHAAGAWRTYSDHTTTLVVDFGQAYVINTTTGKIQVELPAGQVSDYGKVIRVRDVHGQWDINSVTLVPALGDTVKGSNEAHKLERNYLDAELVYTFPGNWEYADNKLVSGIKSSDLSTVANYEVLATEGQTDFTEMFTADYNVLATEVYRRGNLLYYGSQITEDSDYGSIGPINPTPSNITLTIEDSTIVPGYWKGYEANDYGAITGTLEGEEFVAVRASTATDAQDDNYQLVQVVFLGRAKPAAGTVLTITVAGKKSFLYWKEALGGYEAQDADLNAAIVGNTSLSFVAAMYHINSLDGKTIRLAQPCDAGDAVTIVSYLDGLATYRSSYERHQIRLYDEQFAPDVETVPGKRWVGDLSGKIRFSLTDFGLLERDTFNPNSIEILLNGSHLTKSGDADLPVFVCEGADSDNEVDCTANGGAWVEAGGDFSVSQDAQGRWREIVINEQLEHQDILCVRWYNNEIGTTLEWDGDDGIQDRGDSRWLVSIEPVTRKNKIYYTDAENPSSSNAVIDPNEDVNVRIDTVESLLMSVYPIGSIYINAHNKANPADYMGFGQWVAIGEQQVLVGWNSQSPSDPDFGQNNNDLDGFGNPRHSPGATGGTRVETLTKDQIPELTSGLRDEPPPNGTGEIIWGEESLIRDDVGGNIIVGGCQFDPDDDGPALKKYREDFIKTNTPTGTTPASVNNLQPYVTVRMWLRVI